jgi:hypothetical protein
MKHLRSFNESNNIELSSELDQLFNQEVEVRIPINYLLKETNFLILTRDGKIYEFENGEIQTVWNSDEEFKDQTGASVHNEYAGNKSEEFLNFLKLSKYDQNPSENFADFYELIDEIDSIYFEDKPSDLIQNILSQYL